MDIHVVSMGANLAQNWASWHSGLQVLADAVVVIHKWSVSFLKSYSGSTSSLLMKRKMFTFNILTSKVYLM